jgi:arginine utilization protein RocB
MKWNNKEGLKSLAFDLVAQDSISGTRKESDMAKLIYNKLTELQYYRKNPEHLSLVPLNDKLDRYAVCALMRGKKESSRTLLTVAHLDTVGIDDAGSLKEYIFNPYEYTKRLNPDALDEDSRNDLLSGEWLFGRGIMDMKTGLAIQMSLLEYYSQVEDFEGNIMLLAVPDEETNSEGALAAIPFANKVIEKYDLEPLAVLNCEPDFASYPGDDNKYIYLGTVGKLLPGFYIVGKETHVGESLSGLNANLIAGELLSRLEVSTELCEEVDGEVTMPPTCLKYEDTKKLYNVQTPVAGVMYYNLQTMKMNPKEAVERLKKVANEAIKAADERVKEKAEIYKRLSRLPLKEPKFDIKVLTFDELYNQVLEHNGEEFKNHIDKMIKVWLEDETLDERGVSSNVVAEVHKFSKDRSPMIVIFFAPPYYPHVGLNEEREFDRKLIEAADRIIEKANNEYGVEIKKQKYFQGLSDLSYFALEDAEEVMDYLKPNMPSLGYRYTLPLDEIKKLNVPVINYGPHGRDAHKFTERILVDYSYEVVPSLVKNLVDEIFNIKVESRECLAKATN